MAFADDAKADLKVILNAEFKETIQYQQMTAAGAQPWKSIVAIVDRGDASDPMTLGLVARSGPQPIQLTISKDPTDGISTINPRADKVKLDPGTTSERIYSVNEILSREDPAAWRLHAVA
jgi:hypothetical protein